jgi:hypothetical protein
VGWLKVNFDVKDAQPLPIEEGYFLYKFPLAGEMKTSSEIEYGWGSDEYYYYSATARRKLKATGWGEGGMVWGESNGAAKSAVGEDEPPYQIFFIGTEEQYRKYGLHVERDSADRPKIGPLDAH